MLSSGRCCQSELNWGTFHWCLLENCLCVVWAGKPTQHFYYEKDKKKLGVLVFCFSFSKISHMRNAGKIIDRMGPGIWMWTHDCPVSKNYTMEGWTSVIPLPFIMFAMGPWKRSHWKPASVRTLWKRERCWRKLANITFAWSQLGPGHTRDVSAWRRSKEVL